MEAVEEEKNQLTEKYQRKLTSHSSHAAIETNKILLEALKDKMCVTDFLANLRIQGANAYNQDVKNLCLIDIQGIRAGGQDGAESEEEGGRPDE